jgi:hypothetical protein
MYFKTILLLVAIAAAFVMMASSTLQMQTVQAQGNIGNDAGRNCGANTAEVTQDDCVGVTGSFNNGDDAGRNCGANTAEVTYEGDCTSKINSDNIHIGIGDSDDDDGPN